MEIKNAIFFGNYGTVERYSVDTITVLNYSAEVEKPKLTTEKNYNYSNDSEYITIEATAPAPRNLVSLFSVTRTSANVYRYFFYYADLVEYGTVPSLKEIEEYLKDKYKKFKIVRLF